MTYSSQLTSGPLKINKIGLEHHSMDQKKKVVKETLAVFATCLIVGKTVCINDDVYISG